MTTQNSAMGDEELQGQWQHIVFNILGGSDISYTLNPIETTKQRKLIADQFYPDVQKIIKSRDQQIALEAEVSRLETGKLVAFQVIDGVNPHKLHEVFVEQLIKIKTELAALKQAQNKEK